MDKIELLIKIKNLALRGAGGERENASALLDKLMQQYNITDEMLENDEVTHTFELRFKTIYEHRLIHQVIYAVMGKNKNAWDYRYGIKEVGFNCTQSQFIEIQMLYDFFKHYLEEDMQLFYEAFIYKNDIYPPAYLAVHNNNEPTNDELRRLKRVSLMSFGLDKHNVLKQIEGDKK